MTKYLIHFYFLIIIACFIYLFISENKQEHEIQDIQCEIKSQPDFSRLTPTKENFEFICDLYDIKYPEIVYAQAKLESANFTSKIYIENNNCLGLYNSNKKCYFKYDNWIDCIISYKEMIQYRYKEDSDYYTFLKQLPYAEDSMYIIKIKRIVQ